MKLIQLNVWWGGKLTGPLAQLIQTEQPDFLCLQEAVSTEDYTGLFLSIEEMQEIIDSPFSAFAPGMSFNLMHKKVALGNAILSKHPLLKTNCLYTNLEHNKDFDFSKHDYNVRNLLHCVVKTPKGPLHLLTHHGHHVPEHKDGNEQTLRQVTQIRDYVNTLEGAVILTGDFNLAPNSESMNLLNDILQNLPIEHRLQTTRTHLTKKKEVCDYILVNKHVNITNFSASDAVVSDHKALILDFDL